MATKSATLSVGRRAAENVLHAVRFATDVGCPINTHVSISFVALGIDDDTAGFVFQELQARTTRWWGYRRKKGVVMGAMLGAHCHANPAGSRHVHWLLHIPPELQPEFERAVSMRLRRLTGRIVLGDALLIGPVHTPGTLAKYILRGIDPQYADYLHIRAANEGAVSGRRTGVTRAASKTARKRSGWKRRRKSQKEVGPR